MVTKSDQALRYPDSRNINSIEDGLAFEQHVKNILSNIYGWNVTLCGNNIQDQYTYGDTYNGIEIKLDERCTDFARLSIEVKERTSVKYNWVDSGIFSSNNSKWYAQGNFKRFWIFGRKSLQAYYKKYIENGGKCIDYNPNTIKKFYIPFSTIREIHIHILHHDSRKSVL